MEKTAKKIAKRKTWSKDEHRALKAHSKAKTPVVKISKQMKRTSWCSAPAGKQAWYWPWPSALEASADEEIHLSNCN